jgi:hypothetical protein
MYCCWILHLAGEITCSNSIYEYLGEPNYPILSMGCTESFLPALHHYFIYCRNIYLDDRKFPVILVFCKPAPFTGSRTHQFAHEFGEFCARLVPANMNVFPITESPFSNLQSIPL